MVYYARLRVQAKIRKSKYYQTVEQRRIYLEKESKMGFFFLVLFLFPNITCGGNIPTRKENKIKKRTPKI